MKRIFLLGLALALSACGQSESRAQESKPEESKLEKSRAQEHTRLIAQDAELATDGSRLDGRPKGIKVKNFQVFNQGISCNGVLEQGGALLCKTFPNARVKVGGIKTLADKDGLVIIGFDRDAPRQEKLSVTLEDGVKLSDISLNIAPRKYSISRIDGLPPSQVSTFSDAQLKRIRDSSARKKKGFASREKVLWFRDGFTYPLKEFTKTSPFGAQRILNGVKKKPHYGVDIAAPGGTPIYAPAKGVISLADDNLYFEGAMVLIDHGQGLISMYLHMSAIDVTSGQIVKRGEKIGAVGSTGRSTGPHLCWRLKWRNRHLDPELLTKWPSDG
ncbi:MAG: M23 family metallopeptidase [Robiginitomaculum sp.]